MTSKKPGWYSIRRNAAVSPAAIAAAAAEGNEPPKNAAEILIYGEIGESWFSDSVSAADFVRELMGLDASAITVRINSIGGSVPDGIAIHNAIRRHPAHVTTIADGMALSIASLILIAGDTVQMAENATFMVHAPWTMVAGNSAELRDMADQLDIWAGAMSTSYAARTGESQADALGRLTDGKDHWYTAADAKDAGFIDQVIGATPVMAMASFDLSRFHDVPAHLQAQVPNPPVAAANPAAAPFANSEKPAMPAPIIKTDPQSSNEAQSPEAAALEAARAEGARAESQRRSDIAATFKPFSKHEGMAEIEAACLGDPNVTVAVANQRILAQMAKEVTPAAGRIVTVEDERDKRIAAGEQALMARAGVIGPDGKKVRADTSNPLRGMTLLELARASLVRAGYRTEGLDKMGLVAAAFTQTTSDFPILLENTMHKTLQAAYAVAMDTWSRFCKTGSVSDFRAHNRYRVGSLSNLEAVNEAGEFRNKTIPDGEKASITATTKGNIINLTRQTIINDDLDAFVGLAGSLGRAARRTVEADVYATLALNGGLGPTLTDGDTLFHANHANITTGAALSMLAIDADRVAMGSQLDVGGNDFLQLAPAVLLVPIGLGGTARTINEAVYDPDTANKLQKPNQVRGLFRDVVDTPRLSGTRRYLFADPSEAPVLEVAFLDGNDQPFLESEQGFDVDGSRWKVRLDYGIAGIDYRGAVTNAGV
jgi:ATP-dependent protease ClpP protease subunit